MTTISLTHIYSDTLRHKTHTVIYDNGLFAVEMQDVPQVCTKWEAEVRHDDTGYGPWKKVVKFDCTGSFQGKIEKQTITKVSHRSNPDQSHLISFLIVLIKKRMNLHLTGM